MISAYICDRYVLFFCYAWGQALSTSGSQQLSSLLSPLETLFIKAIHLTSLQPPQLWAFATATRDSSEVPSAAVAAQMSWNTFKMEAVSWAEVVCGQLCLFIHLSQIQHVFSIFEPLLHLHYFRTCQETNRCTTLGHTVGGGKIHLMSSVSVQAPCAPDTSYSHWNWPWAQGHFVDES